MSPFDAQGQLVIVTALTLAVAAGVLVTPLTLLALTTIRRWAPETQRAALLVLAAAPALIALAALLAVLLPSMLAMAGAPDHCHDHGGHLHLCFVHFGEHPASTLALVLALGALALIGWRVARAGLALARAHRRVRAVMALSHFDGAARIIPTRRPICASVGLWSPRVVVSEGFLAALTPAARRAALAHEAAHVARRDALWRLVARALAALYPAPVRRSLLGALDIACERAADEHAAVVVGDRLAVARALVDAERLAMLDATWAPLARAITQTSIVHRVESLLELPAAPGHPRRLTLALVVAATSCLALHDVLHHAIESLLAAVFH